MDSNQLAELARLVRYYILTSTTEAGSGHVTSSFSATELMITLMFGGAFKFDLDSPEYANNDRLIFSKGHASPLFYALYAVAGKVDVEELKTLRKFGSRLEGHPTLAFPYTEAATGSLGQGLSVGVGMALNAKLDKLDYRTYVLLGDSETAEGSVWEALELAAYYKLNNLVGIVDVNRLGQRGETMYGWDTEVYDRKFKAFGWETVVVDGHSFGEITDAFKKSLRAKKPCMIIAKTIKGKGVSFLENKEGWHGKALSVDECNKAIEELGKINFDIRGKVIKPLPAEISNFQFSVSNLKTQNNRIDKIGEYSKDELVSTRKAYGNALVKLGGIMSDVVVLDAEVSNSTYAEFFKKEFPDRFFEMFIAEQNMVGAALGFSRRGKIPFVSTFGAFFTRAFDQIRMSAYSHANIKFVGSHCGVSIGEDGVSQMALEDISMFRSLFDSVVLYPSDAVATEKLAKEVVGRKGIAYVRTTRKDTPVLYSKTDEFKIGGSKVLYKSSEDKITVVAAGITLHEAIEAYKRLKDEGVIIRVIDLYSIKPIDSETLLKASQETSGIIVVEDHYEEGGMGEAVRSALGIQRDKNNDTTSRSVVTSLAVRKMPRSGKAEELLKYEEISAEAIVKKVKELL
jgi:transketolase